MKDKIISALKEGEELLNNLINSPDTIDAIEKAAVAICKSISENKKVISCGNGGSMSDAMHFAEEMTGKFRNERRPLAAIAISDPGYITCVANDFGFEHVFSRFVQGHGAPGDTLLAISTSGSSPNVVKAINAANEIGTTTILLTGKPNSIATDAAKIVICTPGKEFADRIQELHIKVIHILIELIENKLVN